MAIQSGDDIKTVQENLGHATAAFTLDVYGHVTAQTKRPARTGWSRKFGRFPACNPNKGKTRETARPKARKTPLEALRLYRVSVVAETGLEPATSGL